ncbi:MAG: ferrous iron transport protein A [Epsilonproteobacteria bacterium]|nr:ferrous iron transport protein A [Campylobacterota bacterium]NPA89604.1 ferrous iron transport protein A [Campylobacterota bacterium]
MKLSQLKQGDIFKVTGFLTDCSHFRRRMESLGIGKGTIGQVVVKSFWGPLEVDFNGRKLALGKGIAKKIEVKKLECPLFGESLEQKFAKKETQ